MTSLSDEDLLEIGYSHEAKPAALNLAKLATTNGARSIVCSPFEASEIRKLVAPDIQIITPGVRPAGSEMGDQKRVMTPLEALTAGADYIVIGRPITDLAKKSLQDMKNGAAKILDSLK